jgi:hypothetical protein
MTKYLDRLIELKSAFIERKVENELILIPLKNNVCDFNRYFTLNEVAAFIWEKLDETHDIDLITTSIASEFDAIPEQITLDILTFENEMIRLGQQE